MSVKSEKRKPFIFVLLPFKKDFDNIYKLVIEVVSEDAGCLCERVDEQYVDGNKIIFNQVFEQIEKADIVIADISGLNPNVFYEVGYAHANKKDIILLTQNEDEIPFDIKPFQYEIYSEDDVIELKEKLVKRVKWTLSKKKDGKKSREPHSKENDINKCLEHIDIYRGRNDKEAMHKNVENIKRLIKLNQKNLPLYDCYLEGADLTEANLFGADLQRANLKHAKLRQANLQDANLRGTNLQEAYLLGANLQWADLQRANLRGADLRGAVLREVYLAGSDLQGAYLMCVDLEGAKGLTVDMLSKVKTLYFVTELDLEIKEELRAKKPELFEKPKDYF